MHYADDTELSCGVVGRRVGVEPGGGPALSALKWRTDARFSAWSVVFMARVAAA